MKQRLVHTFCLIKWILRDGSRVEFHRIVETDRRCLQRYFGLIRQHHAEQLPLEGICSSVWFERDFETERCRCWSGLFSSVKPDV